MNGGVVVDGYSSWAGIERRRMVVAGEDIL